MTAPTKNGSAGRSRRGAGLRQVLVATDHSLDGDRALRRAATLALAPRASVLIAHVLPRRLAPSVEPLVRGAAGRELENAVHKLERLLATRGRHDVTVQGRLRRGQPADEIQRLAGAMQSDLVVVGRRGQSRLRTLVLGSTARRILRESSHAVLVVGRPPRSPYRLAVIGFTLTPEALRAARMASQIVPPTAKLIAVHTFDNPFKGIPPAFLPDRGQKADRQALRRRTTLVQRALAPVGSGAQHPRLIVRKGDPRGILLETAEQNKADLIAVGASGKTLLGRLVIGSVAEGVLDGARCDVLLVRRRA